jgi:hypothetical protein
LWIALPDAERNREPAFVNYPSLPILDVDGFRITVLAGSACGQTSPATVYSPLVGVDLAAESAAATELTLSPAFEHAVLVLRGSAHIEGQALGSGTLLYLGTGRRSLRVECADAAQILVVGGEPFEEEVLLWWNFVGRTREEMEQATSDWNAGKRFGEVKGSPSPPLTAPDISGLKIKAARQE